MYTRFRPVGAHESRWWKVMLRRLDEEAGRLSSATYASGVCFRGWLVVPSYEQWKIFWVRWYYERYYLQIFLILGNILRQMILMYLWRKRSNSVFQWILRTRHSGPPTRLQNKIWAGWLVSKHWTRFFLFSRNSSGPENRGYLLPRLCLDRFEWNDI